MRVFFILNNAFFLWCSLRSVTISSRTNCISIIGLVDSLAVGPRLIDAMRGKIDSALGRHIYSHRISVVELVFGHINTMMNFKRFSLRGKQKVNAQWQLVLNWVFLQSR